jgi:hypothetical protein
VGIVIFLRRYLGRYMLRPILFVFVLLAASAPAFAQSDDMQTLRHAVTSHTWIGVRGGVNVGNEQVTTALDASSGARVGILAGVQLDQWISNMFAVSIAGMLDQKGVQQSYPGHSAQHPHVEGEDNYEFSYLEIPITVRAGFGNGDARPYVFAGPSLGFLLSGNETSSSDSISTITGIKDHLSSTEFSLVFGAGFLDKLSDRLSFTLDVGYAMGLSNIYKDALPDRTTVNKDGKTVSLINNSDAKSGDFRIALALLFGL